MDAKEYLKELVRMFDSLREDRYKGEPSCTGVACEKCPFYKSKIIGCREFFPESVDIVEKWSKEHPAKTMLTDFLEKYPNARLDGNGVPRFCPKDLGYEKDGKAHCRNLHCVDCWNRPLEEVE